MIELSRTCSRTTRRRTPPTTGRMRWSRPSCGRPSRWSGAIAYNTELVKNPPKTLDGPDQAGIQGQADRPGDRPVRRHDLDPRHVRAPGAGRGLLGEAGGARAALFPSGAPISDALVRGEVSIAPLLYNIIYTKIAEGAPVEMIFAPEGVPIIPYADGIPKTAKSPNAAKLFMNWCLSARKARPSRSQAGQPHLAQGTASLSQGLGSQGDQGLGAEVQASSRSCATSGSRSGTRPTAIGSEQSALLDRESCDKRLSAARRPAVDGVSFDVPAGEIVVLLGPSGCGKTTTLRCVAGLEHPTGGRISIGGRSSRNRHAACWSARASATSAWCSSPTRCGRT